MAKKLDFNSVEPLVLELTMTDEARTRISVTTPTEGLIEELQLVSPKLQAALKDSNDACTEEIYDLAARLMSCNLEGLKVTKDELRNKNKYGLNLEKLIFFFRSYIEFINEITHEKN